MFTVQVGFSQQTVSVKLHSLSAHPFADKNLSLHQHKINADGTLTFEAGIYVGYDNQFSRKTALHISASVLSDRFNGISAYTQAGINYQIFRSGRHSIYIGFGPAFFVASSREDITAYVNEEDFNQANTLPNYKFSFLSGFLNYDIILNKKTALNFGINHSQPESVSLTAGIRFRKIGGKHGKGCDCPSYR